MEMRTNPEKCKIKALNKIQALISQLLKLCACITAIFNPIFNTFRQSDLIISNIGRGRPALRAPQYGILCPRAAIASHEIIKRYSFQAITTGNDKSCFFQSTKSREMRSFYLDLNVAYAHSYRIIMTPGLRCSNPRIRDTFVFSEMSICPSVLSLIILNYTKHKQGKTFLYNKSSYFGQLLTFEWHYPALEQLGGGRVRGG